MTDASAHLAVARWGLGARDTELADASRDPRGWVLEQLARSPQPLALPEGVPDALAGEALFAADRKDPRPPGKGSRIADAFQATQAALSGHLVTSATPVVERLTLFWTNHLTVSSRQGSTRALIGDYVVNAIRPHVLGRYRDLLLAAMRHPAMLRYLDQASSIGPDSTLGRRRKRGLNENLAREILELHTVTPAGGYSQADVTQLARILTGWAPGTPESGQAFAFNGAAHEPGPKTLLGRRFSEGEQGGIDALAFLAEHPATHRFLARKLVRHFVSDRPGPGLVERIGAELDRTRGDLGAATRFLLGHDEAWAEPLGKIRDPVDLVVATMRATGDPLPPRGRVSAFAGLGQPLFSAPGPNGWPDDPSSWVGPEAVLRRIEMARFVAVRARLVSSPIELLDATLGPAARPATREAVRRAASRVEGIALVLAAPEFQRR